MYMYMYMSKTRQATDGDIFVKDTIHIVNFKRQKIKCLYQYSLNTIFVDLVELIYELKCSVKCNF